MALLQPPRDFLSSLITSIQTSPRTSTQTANPLKEVGTSSETQKALLTLHVLFPNELLPALDLLDRGLVTRLILQNGAQQRQHPDLEPRFPLHQEEERTADRGSGLPEPEPPHQRPVAGHGLRQPRGLGLPRLSPPQPSQHQSQIDIQEPDAETRLASELQISHHGERQDLDQHAPQPRREHGVESPGVIPQTREPVHSTHALLYVVRSGQLPSRLRSQTNHTPSYEVRLDAWSCSCPAFAFSAFPASKSADIDNIDTTDHQIHSLETSDWKFGGLTLGNDIAVCKHLLACVLVEHCSVFAGFAEEREVSSGALAGLAAGWGD